MRYQSILAAGLVLGLGLITNTASAQDQHHRVTGAQVSLSSVESVRVGEHVRIEQFETPLGKLDLELDRVEVLTRDAQVVLGTAQGMLDMPELDVVVLRGIIAGDADSIAYIAMSPYGTNGFIRKDGEMVSISTGPYAQGKELAEALRTAKMDDVVNPLAGNAPPSACGYEDGNAQLAPFGLPMADIEPKDEQSTRGIDGTSCRVASIAIETDWEYNQRLFDGNSTAAASYIMTLVGAISEIYERDFNTRLAISYLRVWEDDSDPYVDPVPANCNIDIPPNDLLYQVRDHWNASMQHVDRTVTHLLTGRQDMCYGGIAYVGVLCFNEYGYGVSGYLDGSFPYPLVDFHYGNWDVIVMSHELGHNFGTGHTHDSGWYNPTIDDCGNGDCTAPFGGTIMSYCHGCPGGLSNMQLHFHPRVINTVTSYLDEVACDLISVGVTAADDLNQTLEDTSVDIDAMGNDAAQSCDPFVFGSVDSVSANGGSIQRLAGQGPNGRDLFRYTPSMGFVGLDSFGYSIISDQGEQQATVEVNVRALRPADNLLDPIDGLKLAYYEIDEMTQSLPDFSKLEPYLEETTGDISYPSSSGVFVNSGRSELVAALFSGYFWAESDGEYSFWTESNDGSRLYIGEELVVDNDGIHGMLKRGGSIPLRAGWHELVIEFFEYSENAGIFVTVSNLGSPAESLSGSLIAHSATGPCIADLNGDGLLTFFDVSAFLVAFAEGEVEVADLNNDGLLNFFDVSAFLVAYEAGCP
tara:strand:- start:8147 stop:10399 length:2253 start_codon:yes stop_codon:yes gene_type:complete